ncbi:MAG: TonB-dependent receptor [Lautropia sp.]|nr:TonB-dependent receptor [Lautropia sp.]
MFSRTVCAASVLAAFTMGTTSVALAQQKSPRTPAKPLATQQQAAGEAPLVVTANQLPTPADQLLPDVVVLPTKRATGNLSQLTPFQTLGSVQTFSQGTPGSDAGLGIRGHSPRDTLVLIDGFRVTTSSGTDFSLLPLTYGSRTEILRTAGSGVYGPNSAGGVVHLLSERASANPHYSGEAGIGGRGYMQMRGRAAGGNEQVTGRVEFGREVGDGFDVTTRDFPGHQNDEDAWKRENVSGRLDARLPTNTHVTFLAMRNTVNADFDAVGDGRRAKKRLEVIGTKATHELSADSHLDAKISQSTTNHTYNTANAGSFVKNRLREYGLGLNHTLAPNLRGRLAVERLEERHDTVGFRAPHRSTNVIGGTIDGQREQHHYNASLRFDKSNQYAGATSYNFGYGYQLDHSTRLVGSLSRGYRAPDLADYYRSPANNRLKMERDKTIEGGVYWQPNANVSGRAMVYQSNISERLTSVGACTGAANDCSTVNVGNARIRGLAITLAHDTHPDDEFNGLSWRANLDLLKPQNKQTGRELPNVSKRQITGSVDYGFGEYSVGADLVLNSRQFSDEANRERVGAHTLVNLRGAYRATNELTIYADVYNLGNRNYSTVKFYNQQPRTFMFGVAYAPR